MGYKNNEIKLGKNDTTLDDPKLSEVAMRIDSAGNIFTKPQGLAEVAVGGGASLSDYENVIVVDAGGNGNYPSLGDALVALQPVKDQPIVVYIFGETTSIEFLSIVDFEDLVIVLLPGSTIHNNLLIDEDVSYSNVTIVGGGSIVSDYHTGVLVLIAGTINIRDVHLESTGVNSSNGTIMMYSDSGRLRVTAENCVIQNNGPSPCVFFDNGIDEPEDFIFRACHFIAPNGYGFNTSDPDGGILYRVVQSYFAATGVIDTALGDHHATTRCANTLYDSYATIEKRVDIDSPGLVIYPMYYDAYDCVANGGTGDITISSESSIKNVTLHMYVNTYVPSTVTWPAYVLWDGGIAPPFSSAGFTLITLTTTDGGIKWYGTFQDSFS